jgi:hypothetical protein
MNRSPCTRLAFVTIASIIAKRSAAHSLQRSCSANDTVEGPMFGARHQPPLPAVGVGQRIGFCDRLRMRIVIQRWFSKMEKFAEI